MSECVKDSSLLIIMGLIEYYFSKAEATKKISYKIS